ncbi:methyltransferase [Pseudodesulfovibrio sp.]|uniref:tRNA1(Val) (adenine(37)-N6)-methyltransferase n=1 Tax=Pseudodesulfovibrio sp. TaxID=2035812 RepID=UPI00261BDCCA|nr:methyltransferase [Pseudodesulfovibrio sp.]MDD3313641.1 methyltransferase [Pseudodesulfovibrio sp.]
MNRADTLAVLDRRARFPRGLAQPEGGYRFSLDSLLLACFARPGRRNVGADLGCGCGVVGLGLLLRQPGLALTGVELDPAAADAALANADALHFQEKFQVVRADVADWRPERVLDFVVANPPYRRLGAGRVSRGEERATARFEGRGEFARFARCAALALKTRGKFSFVHLPERLAGLLADLARTGLEPKRLRMVHARPGEEARMVLVEAVKAARPGLRAEPPLILHRGTGKQTRLTDEALAFCPFLGCNRGEPEGEER